MLKVEIARRSVREYQRPVRPIDVAAEIGPRLAKATLAAEVDGQVVDTVTPLPADGQACAEAADQAKIPRPCASCGIPPRT